VGELGALAFMMAFHVGKLTALTWQTLCLGLHACMALESCVCRGAGSRMRLHTSTSLTACVSCSGVCEIGSYWGLC
jgi:hypothetical protein